MAYGSGPLCLLMAPLTSTEKLKIKGARSVHLNIRSLYPHLQFLTSFLEPLDVTFCAISETWLKPSIPSSLVHIEGYTLLRLDREDPRKCKGGGLGIYIRNNIAIDATTLAHMNISNGDIEAQWIIIKPPNQKTMIIGNIYRATDGNRPAFIQTFGQCLADLDAHMGKEIHILGDFNLDVKKGKKAPAAKWGRYTEVR